MIKLSSESLQELNGVIKRIYDENPSYWPNGASSKSLDHAYLVREPSTLKTAGFVGWQNINEMSNGKPEKVGYYVIGILPEYRNQGFAKSAVSSVIGLHASEVDDVRAFIVKDNIPSITLAGSLGVKVIHKDASSIKKDIKSLAGDARKRYRGSLDNINKYKHNIFNEANKTYSKVKEMSLLPPPEPVQMDAPNALPEKQQADVNVPKSFYGGAFSGSNDYARIATSKPSPFSMEYMGGPNVGNVSKQANTNMANRFSDFYKNYLPLVGQQMGWDPNMYDLRAPLRRGISSYKPTGMSNASTRLSGRRGFSFFNNRLAEQQSPM